MKITVKYFALLRERMGCESEVLTLDEPEPTVGRVRGLLADRVPALAPFFSGGMLLAAVNREYAAANAVLRDGDELALFPPVSGG